jgi:hypothetical protein
MVLSVFYDRRDSWGFVDAPSWENSTMAKLNASMDDRLPHELLQRKRRQATEVVHRLRKRSATLTGQEIVDAIRQGRERTDR